MSRDFPGSGGPTSGAGPDGARPAFDLDQSSWGRSRSHPMPATRSLVVVSGIVLTLAATTAQTPAEITDRAVTRAFLTLLAGEARDTVRAAKLIEAQ